MLFIIVAFGLIIINEKKETLIFPKLKTKFQEYINTNYAKINDEVEINDISFQNSRYTAKITNKNNKNHYFYIYYSNRKITDTYKKDYLEGKNLLNFIEEKLKKEVKEKTTIDCNINAVNTLNNYSDEIRTKIINDNNLINLKVYNIEKEIKIDKWDKENITKEIINFIKNIDDKGVTPKYYNITITSKNDITLSIQINNITNSFVNNKYNLSLINDIINDSNSQLLKESKITYQYLN